MPLRRSLPTLLAVLLAGCGAGQASSAGDFEGEEKKVAQVVEDLQSAGESQDGAEVCSRLLTDDLVEQLAASGRSCTQEVEKALKDADDYSLEVKDVNVTGSTATARVEDADNRARELRLSKQGADWKIAALGA